MSGQTATDQAIKNAAEQAGQKTAPIRADEPPELAEKINHGGTFFYGRRQKARVLFSNHPRQAGIAGTMPTPRGQREQFVAADFHAHPRKHPAHPPQCISTNG